jgi:hypothetical protein
MQPPRPSRPPRNKSEASDAQQPADGKPLIPDVRENDIVEVGLTMHGSPPCWVADTRLGPVPSILGSNLATGRCAGIA